jgi:hypothetical protein
MMTNTALDACCLIDLLATLDQKKSDTLRATASS